MNLILTLYDESRSILVNWSNVCYVEPRGADDEEPHARIHFNVTAGTGAKEIEVEEDMDTIASMLEDAGETVLELDEEEEAPVSPSEAE